MIAKLLLILFCAATIAEAQEQPIEIIRRGMVGGGDGFLETTRVSAPPEDPKTARLRWNNLESLAGELLDATATEFSWKSPLFEEPLRMRWEAIRRIEQTLPAADKVADSFHAVLRDGSHLLGELTAITEETITLKTTRHGVVALKRPDVLRLSRRQGGNLIAAGPSGDVGWELQVAKKSEQPQIAPVPRLITGPGGALVMPYWNTAALFAITTPARVEIEISLRSSEFPEFSLRFNGDADGLRLETWDNELVVAHRSEFQSVRPIGDDERELSLRICWDRGAKTGSVFTAAGEPLAAWKFTGDSAQQSPWLLENKGRDLTLTHFRVREWNGQPPPKFDVSQPRVILSDGRTVNGSVTAAAGDSFSISGDAASHPLASLTEIVFSTDAPKPDDTAPRLSFSDGTLCHGRIASIAGGSAVLETTFATAPLPVALDGLRQLRLRSGSAAAVEPGTPALDEISIDGTVLHGSLASTGMDRPQWLPIGGVTPATPISKSSLTIKRFIPSDAVFPPAPALFYTSGGDVIPGTFGGINGPLVAIESDIVEAKTLPADALDAVQFGNTKQTTISSFEGPGWRSVKGDEKTVRVSKDAVELDPNTAFGHPSALQSDEFIFSLDTRSPSCVRVRLFAAGTDPAKTTNLVIAAMGGNIYAGWEQTEGQLNNYNNLNIDSAKPVEVRIVIRTKQIAVSIAGNAITQTTLDPKKRQGSGLIFEPASVFGNPVNVAKLSGFSAPATPGRTWLPEINPEVKEQALTVPRFRKERPPRHALVATNGDVLRGEIEATTTANFGFLAGLEKLRVPRDRVSAAIWLKPPRKDGEAAPLKKPTGGDALDQPLQRRVRYSGASLNTLLSALRREAPALKFNTPGGTPDRRRVVMALGGQTIGEALAEICSLFQMRYRVEENGSITLEAGEGKGDEFQRKVYWLHTDPFAPSDSAQARLSEKGVEFPPGTSAQWNPAAKQLVVRHTAAGQAKVSEILEKEFGGKAASLTHWVLLTNGARFAIHAEKFAPDFILGRHPEYGRCQIPMPLVFTIQTTPPAATEVMRAFADWRLEPAREPVLPESGGESSALLAKDAPAFKIPYLAGGEFDLAREKGKVVVLDFWATWCAPCIKAIPDLISAIDAFPKDRVRLIGVNQSEPADAVKRFIETRDWKLIVALDSDQKVAQQYGVTGIPHTVIVGPDGKIAWVKTGYSPEAASEAAAAIEKLLAADKSPPGG